MIYAVLIAFCNPDRVFYKHYLVPQLPAFFFQTFVFLLNRQLTKANCRQFIVSHQQQASEAKR